MLQLLLDRIAVLRT